MYLHQLVDYLKLMRKLVKLNKLYVIALEPIVAPELIVYFKKKRLYIIRTMYAHTILHKCVYIRPVSADSVSNGDANAEDSAGGKL